MKRGFYCVFFILFLLCLTACSDLYDSENILQSSVSDVTPVPMVTLETAIPYSPVPTSTPVPVPDIPVSSAQPAVEMEKFAGQKERFTEKLDSCVVLGDNIFIIPSEFSNLETSYYDFSAWASDMLEDIRKTDRECLPEVEQMEYDTLVCFLNGVVNSGDHSVLLNPFEINQYGRLKLPQFIFSITVDSQENLQLLYQVLDISGPYFESLMNYLKSSSYVENPAFYVVMDEMKTECKLFSSDRFVREMISKIEKEISDSDILTKKERSKEMGEIRKSIRKKLVQAVSDFAEYLSSFSPDPNGIYTSLEPADYEQLIGLQLGMDISCEEIVRQLCSSMTELYETMLDIHDTSPEHYDRNIQLNKSGNAKTVSALKKTTERLSGVKTDNAEIRLLPKTFGVCFEPPFSDLSGTTLWTVSEKEMEDQLIQMALNAFPGTIFRRNCFADMPLLHTFSRLIPCYNGGWDSFFSEWVLLNQNMYDVNDAMFMFSRYEIEEVLLPAVVSLYVNYLGKNETDIKELIDRFPLVAKDLSAERIYNRAISDSLFKVSEAYGFFFFSELFRDLSDKMGVTYDQKKAVSELISLGPSYPGIIRERMDSWEGKTAAS